MFASRNSYGSAPAAWASSSTSCSEANVVCGVSGPRSAELLKKLSQSGSDLALTRRFAMSYCVPLQIVFALPRPGGRSGLPTCWLVATDSIAISGIAIAV